MVGIHASSPVSKDCVQTVITSSSWPDFLSVCRSSLHVCFSPSSLWPAKHLGCSIIVVGPYRSSKLCFTQSCKYKWVLTESRHAENTWNYICFLLNLLRFCIKAFKQRLYCHPVSWISLPFPYCSQIIEKSFLLYVNLVCYSDVIFIVFIWDWLQWLSWPKVL